MLDYNELYAELSVYRSLARMDADRAIEANSRNDYRNAEEKYSEFNGIIRRHFAYVDDQMPREVFPEWPAPEYKPYFSDDELAEMSVVFSDGSVVEVEDDADVPF